MKTKTKEKRIVKTEYKNILITIEYTGNWTNSIPDRDALYLNHLSITTEGRTPIPCTETGYRSHWVYTEKEEEVTDQDIIDCFHELNAGYCTDKDLEKIEQTEFIF